MPTIEFGCTFFLRIMQESIPNSQIFRRSMFCAGHAHASVLVILALVAMLLADQADLPTGFRWAVRIGLASSPVQMSHLFPAFRRSCVERPRVDASS